MTQKKTNKAEWEKINDFVEDIVCPCGYETPFKYKNAKNKAIKFIYNLLSSERQRLIEMIEGMKKIKLDSEDPVWYLKYGVTTYNQAIDEVILEIKKK